MMPVKNSPELLNKGVGGLWTSHYNKVTGSEFVDYCKDISTLRLKEWKGFILTPSLEAKVLVIDTLEDLLSALNRYERETILPFSRNLDFEKMAEDYDAIHLTRNGQIETRHSFPTSLYGWDVESTHWFRWKFTDVEKIELKF